MAWAPATRTPSVPASLARKGVIPAALLAALTGPLAYSTLERWEGNILAVYHDRIADIPTWCAGQTQGRVPGPVGTKLTSDFCAEVNKITLLEYGYAVLACTTWSHLTPTRLVALTIFAINVGKAGACGSQAVRQINAGNIVAGCDLIARAPSGAPNWSFAGGKYVQGLQNRRQAERALCLEDEA
jgi:GH24 family phage-related lysozyme (muramidase)